MPNNVTEKQILKAFDDYLSVLAENKKLSPKKFNDMQTAIYGCKCLVNDLFGSPRKKQSAVTK